MLGTIGRRITIVTMAPSHPDQTTKMTIVENLCNLMFFKHHPTTTRHPFRLMPSKQKQHQLSSPSLRTRNVPTYVALVPVSDVENKDTWHGNVLPKSTATRETTSASRLGCLCWPEPSRNDTHDIPYEAP